MASGPAGHLLPALTVAQSSGTVTGTVAVTLGAVTSAVAGSSVTGTVAVTIGAVTCAASGTASGSTVTGTVAVTLGAVTSAAAGSTVVGTVAQTLAAVTCAASGTHTSVTGTVAKTIAAVTCAAAGSSVVGSTAVTIAAVTAAGYGTAVYGFPTTVAGDGRTLLDQYGNAWFAIADCASSAIAQLSDADQDTYLADRASRGIRAVWAELIEHKFADNAPNDINSNAPFTGTALQSALATTYKTRAVRFVAKAASLGITVFFFPCYLGFSGSGEGWETELAAASNAQATSYGTDVATTFAHAPNIVWIAGGDQNPNATLLDRTDHIMAAIRAGHPGLSTTHQLRASSGHDIWSAYSWRDINSAYVNTGAFTGQIETVYAQETKPVMLIEAYFENEHSTTHQAFRGQMYISMFEDLAAAVFGINPIWAFGNNNGAGFADSSSTPFDTWQHALASPGSLDAGRAAAFIATYTPANWKALAPGVSLVTTGEGTTTAKAGIGVDTAGGRAVVYFPNSRSITLDLSVFTPATLDLAWFDPTNASTTAIGTYANTAGRTVTYPSANSGGDADWILTVSPSVAVTGTVAVTLGPITSAAAGSSTTGTVAKTLGAVTCAATGTHAVAGSVAVTLSAVTSVAAGSSTTGTVAVTLAAVTCSASGTVIDFVGTVAATIGPVTAAASGSTVTGTTAVTLAAVTSAASGAHGVTGTVAVTIGAVTCAAAGTANPPGVAGNVAATLAPVTCNASGSSVTGTVAVTIAAVTCSASGTFTLGTVTGTVAVTLAAVTVAAAGSSVVGSVTVTLAAIVCTASGTANPPGVSGNVAVTLGPVGLVAVGSSVVGTVSRTLGAVACVATGSTVSGSVHATLPPVLGIGSGTAGSITPIIIGLFTLTSLSVSRTMRPVSTVQRTLTPLEAP